MEEYKIGLDLAIASKFKKNVMQSHFYLGCQYEKRKEFKPSIYHFKQVLLQDQSHFGASIHLAT